MKQVNNDKVMKDCFRQLSKRLFILFYILLCVGVMMSHSANREGSCCLVSVLVIKVGLEIRVLSFIKIV